MRIPIPECNIDAAKEAAPFGIDDTPGSGRCVSADSITKSFYGVPKELKAAYRKKFPDNLLQVFADSVQYNKQNPALRRGFY